MKILSAGQIRAWDQYTIEQEPVSSLNLMERAAQASAGWILEHYPHLSHCTIYCGKGNNGGDGLAIGRLLLQQQITVQICILEFGHLGTDDFQANLSRLHATGGADIHFIQSEENIHQPPPDSVLIDALFGSGLNRKLEGVTAQLVETINKSGNPVIAIDIPSGLFVDHSSLGNPAVKATHTLSFQCYKPALLMAENNAFTGHVHILDIGLHNSYLHTLTGVAELTDDNIIRQIYKPRNRFAHKGDFGHALLIAGSKGKTGAAVLAAKACLRAGTGLVSCHIPSGSYPVLQTSVPEAMVNTDAQEDYISALGYDLSRYTCLGIGPGLGQHVSTASMLRKIILSAHQPLVLDADALNLIAGEPDLQKVIPPGSILTPHPKEFDRVFGTTINEFERHSLAKQKAMEHGIVIVLKGHHTLIASPDGFIFYNATGNAGMATAGSGDVLTGVITGLRAQGYSATDAAVLGVYLHGMAGDIAAKNRSQEAMIAGDLIEYLGQAFQFIQFI